MDVLTLHEKLFAHHILMSKHLILFFFIIFSISTAVAEDNKCYELRVYTANEGKLEELNARFRDHTCKLFEKHGFKLIKTKGMIFDSYYVSLLSEQYKYGDKNFLRAFFIGLISNIYAVFSKNGHSSNIYIFKKSK